MRRKPIFAREKIVICSLLVLILVVVAGFVRGQKHVEVAADGTVVTISTLGADPEKIIAQAGFQLGEKDEYRLSTEKVRDKTVITVYRAVPVTLTYQGKTQEIMTGKPTVGELLTEMGIDGDAIRVEPGKNTKITADVQIKVVTVSEKIVEREVEEQYEVIRQPDSMMEQGSEEIVQHGENGTKSVRVKVHFDDGVQVAEEVVEETVIKPAVPEVIKVGTRNTVETSRGAMRYQRAMHMEASAYLPSDGGGSGITATGIAARHGVVAVDPNVIALGTRLFIPGYGTAIAADTGGAIRGNKIDLCMEDYGEAIRFGRRSVKVYILE